MKTKDKLGWTLALCSALFMAGFMYSVYPKPEAEHKYTPEQMARMDDLIAGLTPLSVADLGLEAK